MKQSLWNRAASGSAGRRRVAYERLFFGIVPVFASLARGTRHLARATLALASLALGTWHVALATLALATSAHAQDLTPRVDTLWTRKLADWSAPGNENVDFQASAMGGNPRVLIVAYWVVIQTSERRLMAVNPLSGDTIRSIRSGHGATVQHMSFARNANVFATAEIGLIKVWRWPEMEEIRTIPTAKDIRTTTMSTALLTSDGTRVFDARSGVMYDVATGDTVWSWKRTSVFSVPKITPDDRFLMVFNCGDVLYPCLNLASLLDATTGTELASFPGGSGGEVIAAMAVSDDGRYVAVSRLPNTSQNDGSLVVYDRATETVVLIRTLGAGQGGMRIQFTPNGTGILLGRGIFDSTPNYWSWQYHPAWQAEPIYRFAWMGQYFSTDWTLNYGSSGDKIGVSRFNLETVPVEESASEPGASSTLYPNPTDGTITVGVAEAPDGPLRFDIVSATGQMAASGFTTLNGGTCTITPQPPLAAGSYVIRLMRGTQQVFSSSLIVR